METNKKIFLWIATILLTLCALIFLVSFASLFAILAAVLIAPIEKWQLIVRKYIKTPIKVALAIILSVLMLFTVPSTETPEEPSDQGEQSTGVTDRDESDDKNDLSFDDVVENDQNSEGTEEQNPTVNQTVTKEPEENTSTETLDDSKQEPEESVKEPEDTKKEPEDTKKEPSHAHSFAAATCTVPKTCTCGATEGAANGHNWKAATCTSAKKCSTCGVTEGEKADHSWKAATCTTAKTCTVCKITEGDKSEHSWKDATYSAPKTCSVCGTTTGSALEVPGKENYHGHVYTGGSSSKKYHYEANCAGKNSHEITWDEVQNRNLGPCGTCVLK